MRQTAGGKPVRTSAGAPPNGTSLGNLLRLEVTQDDRLLRIRINYDKTPGAAFPGRLAKSVTSPSNKKLKFDFLNKTGLGKRGKSSSRPERG
jgi:hypothetical protein